MGSRVGVCYESSRGILEEETKEEMRVRLMQL